MWYKIPLWQTLAEQNLVKVSVTCWLFSLMFTYAVFPCKNNSANQWTVLSKYNVNFPSIPSTQRGRTLKPLPRTKCIWFQKISDFQCRNFFFLSIASLSSHFLSLSVGWKDFMSNAKMSLYYPVSLVLERKKMSWLHPSVV